MRKIRHHMRRLTHSRVAHKVSHHGHHLVYVVYYGLAMLEDHGTKLWVVCLITGFHVFTTVTGEEL